MSTQTLVLTQSYAPHKVVAVDRALMMLFQGKIEVVEEYSEFAGIIHADRLSEFKQVVRAYPGRGHNGEDLKIYSPAVVRLTRQVGNVKRGVKFSRINVFTRDGFRCQYCGVAKKMAELNYDHVVPRVQGGKTVWENIVTSCYPCNSRKDKRTPEQAGMKLRHQPYKPKTLPMLGPRFDATKVPAIWIGYFGSVEWEQSAVA
jgi:5-methylcytosine-specific restriction endonuclease McrA